MIRNRYGKTIFNKENKLLFFEKQLFKFFDDNIIFYSYDFSLKNDKKYLCSSCFFPR